MSRVQRRQKTSRRKISPIFLVARGYRDDRDLVFQDCSSRV